IVYRVSMACLFAFWLWLKFSPGSLKLTAAYTFFVWFSVFNLFVVSVFRGFMADIWRLDQAKRLFGFIGVGGTLGALAGSMIATLASSSISPSAIVTSTLNTSVKLSSRCSLAPCLSNYSSRLG